MKQIFLFISAMAFAINLNSHASYTSTASAGVNYASVTATKTYGGINIIAGESIIDGFAVDVDYKMFTDSGFIFSVNSDLTKYTYHPSLATSGAVDTEAFEGGVTLLTGFLFATDNFQFTVIPGFGLKIPYTWASTLSLYEAELVAGLRLGMALSETFVVNLNIAHSDILMLGKKRQSYIPDTWGLSGTMYFSESEYYFNSITGYIDYRDIEEYGYGVVATPKLQSTGWRFGVSFSF